MQACALNEGGLMNNLEDTNTLFAPLEFKFASDGALGEFTGYGSVYNVQDSHGDVVAPKAFAQSLADYKAAGRSIPMHVMHRVFGGDGLPVGVWKSIEEDHHGLKVHGKISGMNTDGGRLLFEKVKDGALPGLSIGYSLKPNGATYGKKPGEPKRTLTNLHLKEISLVDAPSNHMTRVESVKSIASKAELEDLLNRAGLSRAASRLVANDGYAGLTKSSEPEIDLTLIATVLAQHRRELQTKGFSK
jgi:HK97 family phage prohead protease